MLQMPGHNCCSHRGGWREDWTAAEWRQNSPMLTDSLLSATYVPALLANWAYWYLRRLLQCQAAFV